MKKKILIIVSIFIIAFIPFSIMAQNGTDHSYKAIDFRNNIVGIKCDNCNDYYRTSLEGYINLNEDSSWFNSAIDVVEDGVINAKDYAKLYKEYPLPTTTSKTTTTTTKKTTTTTTKVTTTTLPQTTDQDGYNNGIIVP